MRLGTRLVALFVSDPTVDGLVTGGSTPGPRIYPLMMPEGVQIPAGGSALVYMVVWARPFQTLDGADATRPALVQLSCYARHYEDANALADAVEAVLATRSGPGLSFTDGPIFGSRTRRDLSAEYQPQWFHVEIDVNLMSQDT